MWRVIRAEFDYYRWYLIVGVAIALGVIAIVSSILWAVGAGREANRILLMFLVQVPMIVGYVIMGSRYEEKRELLLLSGPLTPRQIAMRRVVISLVLLGLAVFLVLSGVLVLFLLTGRVEPESLQICGYVGGLMFAILQLIPLVQEAAAAREQRRVRAAAAGWAGFVGAILAFAAVSVFGIVVQGPWSWPGMHAANAVIALAAMIGGVFLYAGRTDFTR